MVNGRYKKNGPSLCSFDKLDGLFGELVLRECLAGCLAGVAGERLFFVVAPQIFWIVVVRVLLAEVAIEQIEAVSIWVAGCAAHAQAPFADRAGGVALSL